MELVILIVISLRYVLYFLKKKSVVVLSTLIVGMKPLKKVMHLSCLYFWSVTVLSLKAMFANLRCELL